MDVCYFEGEPCVSDNLEDSRRADEESELGSILTYPTLRRRHCQPQAPFKKPADCLDERSINKHHPTSMAEQRAERLRPQLTKSWPSSIVAGNRDWLTPFISSSGIFQTTWFMRNLVQDQGLHPQISHGRRFDGYRHGIYRDGDACGILPLQQTISERGADLERGCNT